MARSTEPLAGMAVNRDLSPDSVYVALYREHRRDYPDDFRRCLLSLAELSGSSLAAVMLFPRLRAFVEGES